MRTLLGMVVAFCVIVLLMYLAHEVYRHARRHGRVFALAAAAGAVAVAYAVLAAAVSAGA